MAKPRYHIFLSYRREDGKDLARTLKETLVGKGYRVFLDMDELQDGVFDERIQEAMECLKLEFLGHFDCPEDFAEQLYFELYEIPAHLENFIDWRAVWRNLDTGGDYAEFDGHIFRT